MFLFHYAVFTLLYSSFSFISGIKEKITGSVDAKKDEMAANAFGESIKKMVQMGEISMQKFLEMQQEMLNQSSGWKAKMASMAGQNVDTAAIEKSVAVLNALTPAERASFKRSNAVTFMIKQRISHATKLTPEEINIQLRKFDEMAMIAKWLQRRNNKKQKLPDSVQEMQRMMAEDPPDLPDSMKPKQRRR